MHPAMGCLAVAGLFLLQITSSWAGIRPTGISRPIAPTFERPTIYFPSDFGYALDHPVRPFSHGEGLTSASCKCGRTHTHRIVGGSRAKSGEWCWQAKVMVWSKDDDGSFFLCGGSIINDEYILSAAHCFHGHEGSKVDIYLGAYKLFGDVEGTKYNVDFIKLHADYDDKTKANDIALVKLTRKIKFTDRVCSVCLPATEKNYTGEICTITGWGALKSGGDSPVALMEAQVKVISHEKCQKQYGYLDPSQICAAAPGVDSCQGDSGGPMVHQGKNGIWDLVGIVSAGKGCADPDFAGLYTNVYEFLPWIRKNTEDSESCSRY
ncbi:venom peptide isomerase heavy chain-like [Hetaerina americana]|uniref:venom peptide isomerase heavy chain-like n=1 Tax=Hetaerina americana TaxID=62018 RepID=UPI003A7F40D6